MNFRILNGPFLGAFLTVQHPGQGFCGRIIITPVIVLTPFT
jgi:hypothetical protein